MTSTLTGTEITLRALRYRDKSQWQSVRVENRDWLSPWEATLPQIPEDCPANDVISSKQSFSTMVRSFNREARAGRTYSFAIWRGPNIIGQITMGGVIYGALRGAHIGYWIDRNSAGRGYTTEAVILLTNFAFTELGLHRVEINVRPENIASCRVAEKAGFHFEGERENFLHIDGSWRHHKCFVKVNELIR